MIKGQATAKQILLLLLAVGVGVFVFKSVNHPARQYSLTAIIPPKTEPANPFNFDLYPVGIPDVLGTIKQPQPESPKWEIQGESLDIKPVSLQTFSIPGPDGVQRQVSEAAFWSALAFPQTYRLDLIDKMN